MSKCPICKIDESIEKYKPFCSKRCGDVDLGNWFSGKYAFEANNLDEDDIIELEQAVSEKED